MRKELQNVVEKYESVQYIESISGYEFRLSNGETAFVYIDDKKGFGYHYDPKYTKCEYIVFSSKEDPDFADWLKLIRI